MWERAEDLGTDDEQMLCNAGLEYEYMADGDGTGGHVAACPICRDWAMNKANTPSALAKSLGARKFCFKLSAARTAGFIEFRRQIHLHLGNQHQVLGLAHKRVQQKKEATHRQAGMAVARTAYAVLWEASSYRSFIRALQLQHISGVYLGDLQHDRGFMPKFLNAAHDEVRFRMKKFMHTATAATGRKPVFSLAADKLTLLKRNSQAVVLFAMVEGEVTPMYLSAPLVTQHMAGSMWQITSSAPAWGFSGSPKRTGNAASLRWPLMGPTSKSMSIPTSTASQAASPRCFVLLCGAVPTALSWLFSTYINAAPPNSE
jgi:hypothetical protein